MFIKRYQIQYNDNNVDDDDNDGDYSNIVIKLLSREAATDVRS